MGHRGKEKNIQYNVFLQLANEMAQYLMPFIIGRNL